MNKRYIPSGISALRIAALPLFLYFYSNGSAPFCILVFGLAQVTDLLDGYVARKMGVTSRFGAYFDAATDFVLITGIFAAFTFSGLYPIWMMLLIIAMFVQFVLTSMYTKRLYDPLGKYIGSVLYIAIGLTLLSPSPPTILLVQVGFPLFAAASLVTRTASFTANYRRSILSQQPTLKHPVA